MKVGFRYFKNRMGTFDKHLSVGSRTRIGKGLERPSALQFNDSPQEESLALKMSPRSIDRANRLLDQRRMIDEARGEATRLQQHSVATSHRGEFQINPVDVQRSALWLLERWIGEVRQDLSPADIVRFLSEFVHKDEKLKSIGGPLIQRLKQFVPKDSFGRWEYMEELLEAFKLEDQFDQRSYVHAKTPPLEARLKAACRGRPPAVFLGTPANMFSWDSYVPSGKQLPRLRATAVNASECSVNRNSKSQRSRNMVPGPGSYSEPLLTTASLKNPRQGVFPSVGGPRTKCSAVMLSQRGRFSFYRVR